MKVTIKDIARAAHVSPSTVSRVVSGSGRISEVTTRKIHAIMKDMHYRPNQLARSLVKQNTNIVGAVFPCAPDKSLEHPFYPEVLRGIGAMSAEHGYQMLLASTLPGEDEAESLRKLVYGGIVEGIILLASRVVDPVVGELIAHEIPFVVIGHPAEREAKVNWVDNDNVQAGRLVTEHVLAHGHRRIAFLGLDPDFQVTLERMRGYQQALSAAGITPDPALVIESPFNENLTDASGIEALFSAPTPPTAVVVGDDFQAIFLMGQLTRLGLRVPEDVSVTGFNNVLAGSYTNPTLTTVDIDAYGLGKAAFSLLLDAIQADAPAPRHEILPIRFIQRASVAAAKK